MERKSKIFNSSDLLNGELGKAEFTECHIKQMISVGKNYLLDFFSLWEICFFSSFILMMIMFNPDTGYKVSSFCVTLPVTSVKMPQCWLWMCKPSGRTQLKKKFSLTTGNYQEVVYL